MVRSNYVINLETLAILPAKQMDYDSNVLTKSGMLHSNQLPLDIIRISCLENWTTYEASRTAAKHHMHFTNKVPILVNKQHQLYFFPTHSPTHIDNCWIAANHIEYIQEARNQKSYIQFKCGQKLILDVSTYTLQKQKNRAYACMFKFNQMTTDRK